MNLREYLRMDFHKYIRNKIINKQCDFCGEVKELHLHHIDRFYNLLMETLDELNLCELDTDNYSNEELKTIKYYMLGKQIQGEYKTLCKKCHRKLHFIENKSEEYREHYYNPFGEYVYVNIKILNKLNISNANLCHFIMLATYVKYNNNVLHVKVSNNKYNILDEKEIIKILTLKKTGYYRLKKVLIENKLIEIDDNQICIDNKIIKKGNINNKNDYIKIFVNNYRRIYNLYDNRRLKNLGGIIKLSEYININNELAMSRLNLENILGITHNGVLRFINSVNECFKEQIIKQIDKNLYIVNPKLYYNGEFTDEFKQVVEKYHSS